MADEPIFRVLGHLEAIHKTPSGWDARCPGPNHKHDDRHPSLSVGQGNDGRVLLKCFAGCATDDIVRALRLEMKDLFPQVIDNVRRIPYRLKSNGEVRAIHERVETPEGKRYTWKQPNGESGLRGLKLEDMPLYGIDDIPDTGPIVLTEGEKSAQALLDLGVPAVGTVTGAASTPSAAALARLQGREVWLWPDNDAPGAAHMQRIAEGIQPPPRLIYWRAAPDKGDAADYVAGGGQAADISTLLVEIAVSQHSWTLPQLLRAEFPPLRWAIPRLLCTGCFIMAGKPKLGKSTLLQRVSADIVRGAPVLGKIPCERGEVLYLALEESPRRMQTRLMQMLGEDKPPEGMTIATWWPRADKGGMEDIEAWLKEAINPRLVVIDTFVRFKPPDKGKMGDRLYDRDYDSIVPMVSLALKFNISLILVFHVSKAIPDDPLEMVSGTLGLTGAADGVMILKRERGQATASLFVTGRDVEERDLALRRDEEDLSWALLGDASEYRLTAERAELLKILEQQPGMKPAEIADAIGWLARRVRRLLFSMAHDGQVRIRDGHYYPPVDTAPLLLFEQHRTAES